MSLQILDVGDEVVTSLVSFPHPCRVVRVHPTTKRLLLIDLVTDQTVWAARECLSRVGGELQVGDLVRVTGDCAEALTSQLDALDGALGLIADDIDGSEWKFVVFHLGTHVPYGCRADQLTRLTRAEALS